MHKTQSFTANKIGRDFVVGDIHGHFKLLKFLLKKAEFNKESDRIFSVGDLIDRGPDSIDVMGWLQEPWFHAVRGNHEQMLIDCITSNGDIPRHTRNGGAWLYNLPLAIQQKLSRILKKLPLIIEVELLDGRKIGIVHAETPLAHTNDTWKNAKDAITGERGETCQRLALEKALYARDKIESQDKTLIRGIDQVYVGHSTVNSVTRLGNVTYIDTGCSFDDGALTLIELNTQAHINASMRTTHRN
ncbi:metallophosphoesterase [Pseudomonas cichorii]|uniref:metallophosphoesterase n=1 Tax=Pseudomonas cichorii TaxID=36746 RepID=UPI0018E641F9|nr:metallophosphoesterase [Pseudomonas cichorii]MBI6855729.1 metallophosphoesterase [Pseudomonas cichorii]